MNAVTRDEQDQDRPWFSTHPNGVECVGGYVGVLTDENGKSTGEYVSLRSTNPRKRAVSCRFCAADRFLRQSGLDRMTWATWANSANGVPNEQLERFRCWAPGERDWSLVLFSSDQNRARGNGKTHLLAATACAYVEHGRAAMYQNGSDLEHDRYSRNLWELADYTGLLLVDDLGSEANNAPTRDTLDRVLDRRFRLRRPTIATSRRDWKFLSEKFPRFTSRTAESSRIDWVELDFATRVRQGLVSPVTASAGGDPEASGDGEFSL